MNYTPSVDSNSGVNILNKLVILRIPLTMLWRALLIHLLEIVIFVLSDLGNIVGELNICVRYSGLLMWNNLLKIATPELNVISLLRIPRCI